MDNRSVYPLSCYCHILCNVVCYARRKPTMLLETHTPRNHNPKLDRYPLVSFIPGTTLCEAQSPPLQACQTRLRPCRCIPPAGEWGNGRPPNLEEQSHQIHPGVKDHRNDAHEDVTDDAAALYSVQ